MMKPTLIPCNYLSTSTEADPWRNYNERQSNKPVNNSLDNLEQRKTHRHHHQTLSFFSPSGQKTVPQAAWKHYIYKRMRCNRIPLARTQAISLHPSRSVQIHVSVVPVQVVNLTSPANSTPALLRRKMCSHFVLATPRRISSFRCPSCRDVKPSPHRFSMQWFSSFFSACTVVNRSLDLVLQKNIGSNFSITAVLSLQKYY